MARQPQTESNGETRASRHTEGHLQGKNKRRIRKKIKLKGNKLTEIRKEERTGRMEGVPSKNKTIRYGSCVDHKAYV